MSANPQAHEQQQPRLLFFFDQTDGHARRIEGYLAQILQRGHNHDTFQILRIDVRQRPDLAIRFQIEQTPTLCIIDNRRIAAQAVQPRNAKEITRLLAPWLRPLRHQYQPPQQTVAHP